MDLVIVSVYTYVFSCRRLPISNKPIEDDDVDVANERQRVLRGGADNDMLKIDNLTKVTCIHDLYNVQSLHWNGQTPVASKAAFKILQFAAAPILPCSGAVHQGRCMV